jgi:tetratricopeptide (TPR) repeat protein
MLRALGDYTRLVFFPTNLHLERSVAGRAGGEYLAIAGAAALALLLYGASRQGAGRQARLFGAGWFLITYLPISNLFRLNATVAEHWLYLPSVGLLIFLAGLVLDLPTRHHRTAVSVACLAVFALTARSAVRSSDWVDAETFFSRTFAAGGNNSRIGVNLAGVHARRGEHDKAETILRKVLELSPQYALARSNLALALSQQGKTEEAASTFESANAPRAAGTPVLDPTWDAALHLARIHHAEGKTEAALALLTRAQQEFPGTWPLIEFESEIRHSGGERDAALQLVEEFVSNHWWHARAAFSLALLYVEKEDLARADAMLHHASRLDVYDTRALNLRASIHLKQNRAAQAYHLQRRAIHRQPNDPRQYLILAELLSHMGRNQEAHALVAGVHRMQAAAAGQSTF